MRRLFAIAVTGMLALTSCSSDPAPLGGASTETLTWAGRSLVAEYVPALDVDDTLSSGPATRHAVRQSAASDEWVDLLVGLDDDGEAAIDVLEAVPGDDPPPFAGPVDPAAFTRGLRADLRTYFREWVGTPDLEAALQADGVAAEDTADVVGVIAEVLAEDWLDLFRLDLVDAVDRTTDLGIDGQLLADAAVLLWADEAGPVFDAFAAGSGPLAGRVVALAVVSARADDRFSAALSDAMDAEGDPDEALRAALPDDPALDHPVVTEAADRVDAGEAGDLAVNDSEAAVAEQVATIVAETYDETNRSRLETVVSGMASAYATAYQLTLLEVAAA